MQRNTNHQAVVHAPAPSAAPSHSMSTCSVGKGSNHHSGLAKVTGVTLLLAALVASLAMHPLPSFFWWAPLLVAGLGTVGAGMAATGCPHSAKPLYLRIFAFLGPIAYLLSVGW